MRAWRPGLLAATLAAMAYGSFARSVHGSSIGGPLPG